MEPTPGDVILYPVTPKSGWQSRFVAIGEFLVGAGKGSVAYSHAAILSTREGYEYEAKWPMTGHFKIDKSRPYEIWNIGNPRTDQRLEILAWCRARQGEMYNMIGLLTGGLLGLPHTEVCSQFVGLAYESAGIQIDKEGVELLSPNAIPDYPGATMVSKYSPKEG